MLNIFQIKYFDRRRAYLQYKEKLEQERILLRTLINNIPDAIFAKDNEGRKIIANLADLNNMGCDSEEEAVLFDDVGNGFSCIINPLGFYLAGPLKEEEGILFVPKAGEMLYRLLPGQ